MREKGGMADVRFSHIMTTISLEINSQAFVTIADWDVVGNGFQAVLQSGSTSALFDLQP